MISVAIIGAGAMGATHARAYARLEGVEVAAIVDTMEEKAQKLASEVHSRPVYQSEEIFQDPGIDMVDVTLPTPLHARFAMRALECGKHVMIEKPFARNLEEVDQIIGAAQRSSKFLMVAQVLRFWPEYVAIRDVISSGQLGRPLMATACRLSDPPSWADWLKDDRASGGMVLDLQIHDLDVLNWMFGRPRSVLANGVQNEAKNWVHCLAQVNYASLVAYDEASHRLPDDFPYTTGLRVICEKGILDYSTTSANPYIEEGRPGHHLMIYETGHKGVPLPFIEGNAYANEVAYFIDCIRSNQAPQTVTMQDARLAVETCLAVRASLDTGFPVDL
jgi:predicted dehydrogenase